jgi:hypothetical protein
MARRLTASVRWPARRMVGGGLYPKAAAWVGGWRGSGPVPGVGGRRGAAGRPGGGARGPKRRSLPPPNHALEPTAPSGRLCPGGRLWVGAAAHRERSVARAAGGRRDVIPTSVGVWVVQGVWHPGRASVACGRPGTGPLCPRHHALPPTEQRTGADRPQRPLFPVRVSVPGGGSSPRALGAAPVRAREEASTGRRSRCRTDPYLEGRCPCVTNTRTGGVGGRFWVG